MAEDCVGGGGGSVSRVQTISPKTRIDFLFPMFCFFSSAVPSFLHLLLHRAPQWICDFANPNKKRRRRLDAADWLSMYCWQFFHSDYVEECNSSATIWCREYCIAIQYHLLDNIQFFKGLSQSSSSSSLVIQTLDQLTFLTRFLFQLQREILDLPRSITVPKISGVTPMICFEWWIK